MANKNEYSKKDIILNGLITAVYFIAIGVPTIALSWVGSTIFRMITGGPSIIEHLVLFLFCLIGQACFGYFLFKRRGFDNRNDSIEYWRSILICAVVFHSAAALISSFSAIVCGSAVTNLGQFIYLCIFPKTELPLEIVIPSVFYLIGFIITEALFVLFVYLGIKKGKEKRSKEREQILNNHSEQ